MISLIGLGAGGHARVVIEILRLAGGFDIVGLLDASEDLHGTELLGIKILGNDSLLEDLRASGVTHAFIGLGTVRDITPRLRVFEKARQAGFDIAAAIHPRSTVSPSAKLGKGPTVMAGAVINALAELGEDVIVNTGATVDHDCLIGNHVHISVGVNLGGNVAVGDRSLVGMGAVVLPGIKIGADVIVGAGSLVTRDVPDGKVVFGHPAKIIRDNSTSV